jgi:hypothetical protein
MTPPRQDHLLVAAADDLFDGRRYAATIALGVIANIDCGSRRRRGQASGQQALWYLHIPVVGADQPDVGSGDDELRSRPEEGKGYLTVAGELPELEASDYNVEIATGSRSPVTRMSTVRICGFGMLVAADNPVASSPAGFHDPTTYCVPSSVVTTMS